MYTPARQLELLLEGAADTADIHAALQEAQSATALSELIALRRGWILQGRSDVLGLLRGAAWSPRERLIINGLLPLWKAALSEQSLPSAVVNEGLFFGLHPIPATDRVDVWQVQHPFRNSFDNCLLAWKRCWEKAGGKSNDARALAGMMDEFISNASEHACAPQPSVFSFDIDQATGRWSMAVTDVGIGIRQSIQKNPAHHDKVKTDSDALRIALSERGSSLTDPVRGTGFNTVFKRLAGRGVEIRMHAGSVNAVWSGRNPTAQEVQYITLPLENRKGFHVELRGQIKA